MDKQKVANLAKSFSFSCKQVVKDKQLMQKTSSPALMLTALTVLTIVAFDVQGSKRGWAG
jgi:hypothetical protein